jgi:hypothetical protein
VSQPTICHQHRCDSIMAASRSILMDSWLTALRAAVRKRCTSTWSLSATSILASLPPPVSRPNSLDLRLEHRAHIHNRSLDLQVRRYRQAYYREVREGKNISSSLPSPRIAGLIAILPLGGADSLPTISKTFCARTFLARQPALLAAQPSQSFLHRINFSRPTADSLCRKPPSWARVLSSMRGFLTS